MGINSRFKLSDMMPYAWFYKLKEMSKPRKTTPKKQTSSSVAATKSQLSEHRKSYHISRELNSPSKTRLSEKQSPPRKSTRIRRSTKRYYRSPQRHVDSTSSPARCSCRAGIDLPRTAEDCPNSLQTSTSDNDSVLPEFGSDRGLTPDTFDGMLSCSTSCKCSDGIFSEHDNLPPIITKKQKNPTRIHGSVKVVKEADLISSSSSNKTNSSPIRRRSPSTPGLKLRTHSPRLANRRKIINGNSGSTVSESFAVVKSSSDPRSDFRESMMEMIVENNIRAAKDLEELLACYLSLNSDEYHDLIINVFKQIWPCIFIDFGKKKSKLEPQPQGSTTTFEVNRGRYSNHKGLQSPLPCINAEEVNQGTIISNPAHAPTILKLDSEQLTKILGHPTQIQQG